MAGQIRGAGPIVAAAFSVALESYRTARGQGPLCKPATPAGRPPVEEAARRAVELYQAAAAEKPQYCLVKPEVAKKLGQCRVSEQPACPACPAAGGYLYVSGTAGAFLGSVVIRAIHCGFGCCQCRH